MDEFKKNINLSFDIDKDSYDEVKKAMQELEDGIELGFDDETVQSIKSLGESLSNVGDVGDSIEKTNERMSDFADSFLGGLKMEFSDIAKFATNWQAALAELGVKFIADFVEKVSDLFKDAWNELGELLKYSQLTDSTVREQAFTYGFNPAQNYAYSKTMSFMGLSSEKDMWYLNEQQWKEFNERFSTYTERYQSLYDQGFFEDLQEFNWSMEEFKDEMLYEVVEFFIDNKETIMAVFKAVIFMAEIQFEFFKQLMEIVRDVTFSPTSESERASKYSDIINGGTTTNNQSTTNNYNVKMDNNFNQTGKVDRDWFANMGQQALEQVIVAIGGKNIT